MGALGELFPEDVMPEYRQDNEDAKGRTDVPSLQSHLQRGINGRYVGVLQRELGRIQVLDSSLNLAEVGSMTIPHQVPIEAVCVGGDHMYMMSEGPEPRMWRLPIPKVLRI